VRRTAKALSVVLLLAICAGVASLVLPLLQGEPSRVIIVSGRSMEPTFHTGDLILTRPSDDYQQGQVVPYRVPEGDPGEGGLVIHRIVGGSARDGFVMQGDNNPTPDIWTPLPADMIGRQVLLVPRVGLVMAWIRQPAVLAALVAGLVTCFVLLGGTKPTDDQEQDQDQDQDQDDEQDQVIDLRDPSPVPAQSGTGT
jgi:signal peptidase